MPSAWARTIRVRSWLEPHRRPALFINPTQWLCKDGGANTLVRHLFASFGDCGTPKVLRHDALELAFRNGTFYHSPNCCMVRPISSLLRPAYRFLLLAAGISLFKPCVVDSTSLKGLYWISCQMLQWVSLYGNP
jgi:hypothetical protein